MRPTAGRQRLEAERRRAVEEAVWTQSQAQTPRLSDETKGKSKAEVPQPGVAQPVATQPVARPVVTQPAVVPQPNLTPSVGPRLNMEAIVTQADRFCRNVPDSHPEKSLLEEYDVSR